MMMVEVRSLSIILSEKKMVMSVFNFKEDKDKEINNFFSQSISIQSKAIHLV